jgi:glycosyltransferase involved in cell wall biosynthesis
LPAQSPVVSPVSLVPASKRVLLAVGRLSEEKQPECLVSAFKAVADTHAGWVLAIVGEGPMRPALERQVEATGLRGRVLLPGSVGTSATGTRAQTCTR